MRKWLGLLLVAAVVGCGGGTGGSTAPAVPKDKPAMGTLSVRIIVPGAKAATNQRLRKAFAAADSTNGILFTVFPHTGNPSTQAIATNGDDISLHSSNCVASGTGRTCTVSILAPVGTTNDLLTQTYDQAIPANGVVPAGAHLLAAATTPNVNIASGTNNSVSITLNPVLASVTLMATPNQIHAMLPASNISISVLGFDAGGNLIVAGNYVDANGNPVSVSLTTTNNPNSSFTLTSSPVTGSGQAATATYNGAANTSGSIQVSSSSPYASTLNISLLQPLVYAISDPNLTGFPSTYQGIQVYSVGLTDYVYYTVPAKSGLSYIVGGTNGANAGINTSQTPVALPTPAGPVSGGLTMSSSIIYTGGVSYNTQFNYTASSPPPPFPQVSASCSPNANASCATTGGLTFNGHVIYGSGKYINDWTPGSTASTINSTPLAGTPVFGGFSYDNANGKLWFVDTQSGFGNVYMETGGTLYVPGSSIGGIPFDVSPDQPTGGAFVTVPALKRVLFYGGSLPGATVTTFNTTGFPQYVYSDNVNGALFTETSPSGQVILGRIDPTTHVLGEYTLPSISGGQAGPISALNYATVIAIVHYGGASGGEILLVVP